MALITPEEYATAYPEQTVQGAAPTLATLIARADMLMAIACGMPQADDGALTLESADYTLHPCRAVQHRRCLLVGVRLPTAIASVHVSSAWTWDATTLVDPGDYAYEVRSGELWLAEGATLGAASLGGWSRKPRANRVVLTAGWASGAAPEGIKAAALVQTRYLTQLDPVVSGDAVSQSSGWFTPEQVERFLAPGVREALLPYRYNADPLPKPASPFATLAAAANGAATT